jgi:integrase
MARNHDAKTDAGKRTITVPPHVVPILEAHMKEWSGPDRVFVGRDGAPMRGDAVRQAFTRARKKVGMPGFRFHDLRHTGQTLAASAGATLKDLMLRLGHASPVAAQRYLHAVEGRDAEIASALSDLAAHGSAARLPKSIVVKH